MTTQRRALRKIANQTNILHSFFIQNGCRFETFSFFFISLLQSFVRLMRKIYRYIFSAFYNLNAIFFFPYSHIRVFSSCSQKLWELASFFTWHLNNLLLRLRSLWYCSRFGRGIARTDKRIFQFVRLDNFSPIFHRSARSCYTRTFTKQKTADYQVANAFPSSYNKHSETDTKR